MPDNATYTSLTKGSEQALHQANSVLSSGAQGDQSHLNDLLANQFHGSSNAEQLLGLNQLWGFNGLGGLGHNLNAFNNLGLLHGNGMA